MKVFIPTNFQAERKYTLEVFLKSFLGVEYLIVEQTEIRDTIFELENKNQLIIKDYFFNNYSDTYLYSESIPTKLKILERSCYLVDEQLPILYGNHKIGKNVDKEITRIVCHIDIIASSFFMLSRWEEYVNKERDMHGRFPGSASLAFKNNFLNRPIVNEYLELLWNMLLDLGISQNRKERSFDLLLSHDIDVPLKWTSAAQFSKEFAGDFIKRKSPARAYQTISTYLKSKLDIHQDPYNTFSYLMDVSEQHNTLSHFFFISGGNSIYDNKHAMDTPFMHNVYNLIEERGHVVGFHPSYNTYNDSNRWYNEYEILKDACNYTEACGRQHYLRFEVPSTWQIWEDNNMKWDSTAGYADQIGFRCGTCYEFPVFNIITRQQLKLIEKPLIVMEVTLPLWDETITRSACTEMVKDIIEKIKKYKGTFNFLWHNSSFNIDKWKNMQEVYQCFLEYS